MRIGFLFNHDQVHQVAHSLPIALALARAGTGAEIILATTNAPIEAEVTRLAGAAFDQGLRLHRLRLNRLSSRIFASLTRQLLPADKVMIYRDNLDFFRSLDILVVPEKTSLLLKSYFRLDNLKIVHTRHGAGDRAIGFDAASANFDHVLVAGAKIRDRLIRDAGVDPDRITIVGYPKFDICDDSRQSVATRHDRKVVLYNPHVSPHLSSWYRQGREVLDWFLEHDEYQLIFAPHVMLYQRPLVITIDKFSINRPGQIDDKYFNADNIHIDLGSRVSTTMNYTNAADIYLGDVSSQVYEFLRNPRPCVFLNTHRVDWRGNPNYAHWAAGPVIEDCTPLARALDEASSYHERRYKPVQEALFDYSFDLNATASSERAAHAIAKLGGLTWRGAGATHIEAAASDPIATRESRRASRALQGLA